MKKKFSIAILIAFTIAMGFLRDYFFVSINHFIEEGADVSGKLSFLKWVLTILFSILYLLTTCSFLYILFRNPKYIWIAVFSYLLLFAIALLSAVAGYFFSSFESVYPFIRNVLGVAQSPIVMMVLIPSCFLNEAVLVQKESVRSKKKE